MDITLQQDNRDTVVGLIRTGRIPHTVIIEGDSKEERDSAALLLAAGAVCAEADRPCLSCIPCRKVLDGVHHDVTVPMPSKASKTGIIALKDLREYLSTASIKPNEADLRIYIFCDADKLLREDAQNTLLKIIEEPPQDILFIFTAEKAKLLLPTVRSRAHIITLRRSFTPGEDSIQAAGSIVDGIVSLYEYDLLSALSSLGDKTAAQNALALVTEELRLAMLYLSGVPTEDTGARKLARKLDRARVLALIDVTREAVQKLKTNINLQLLLTWLCTRYRRITWQK